MSVYGAISSKYSFASSGVEINEEKFGSYAALTSPDNHTTSFYKLVRDLNAYDLEGELIIRDQPGAVNPMGTELRILLTERRPADTISVSDNDKQESEEK